MTLLEKMARAHNARLIEQNLEDYMRWEELSPEERAWEIEAMRAALTAAREPTDAMIRACEENFARDAWRDMVDVALAEGVA